jgi:hypothetical protein
MGRFMWLLQGAWVKQNTERVDMKTIKNHAAKNIAVVSAQKTNMEVAWDDRI